MDIRALRLQAWLLSGQAPNLQSIILAAQILISPNPSETENQESDQELAERHLINVVQQENYRLQQVASTILHAVWRDECGETPDTTDICLELGQHLIEAAIFGSTPQQSDWLIRRWPERFSQNN